MNLGMFKNGTFQKIKYKSEMPLKAEYRKQGYEVVKITQSVGRLGVNYKHMKGYQPPTHPHKVNNFSWIIPNKLAYNSATKKLYVHVAWAPHPSKVTYEVYKDGLLVGNELDSNMVIDSYFKGDKPLIKSILLDNIIEIGGVAV